MKSALITGCSSGIGRALCEEYLHQGYRVYATARNLSDLDDLTGTHPTDQLIKLTLDVNDADSIQALVNTLDQRNEALNVLINNAGYAAMGPLVDMPLADLQQQFATNVFAPIEVTKALLPILMKEASTKAQVVNIGSVSGITTTPFSGAYCATKAAIHALSDALRMELAPFNIDVITIQPGAIESKFGDNSLANLASRIQSNSLYAPLKDAIESRATASQDNPTSARSFAKTCFNQLARNPNAEIRIGNGSRALPWLKRWLPTPLLDRMLMKKFKLHTLKR